MNDYRLPDGTWVTTPIAIGGAMTRAQCPGGCDWKDVGEPSDASDRLVRVQSQQCARCHWVRGKYLGNPHPEIPDAGRSPGP
jgi:hypothetical protein